MSMDAGAAPRATPRTSAHAERPLAFGILLPMVAARMTARQLLGELVDEVRGAERAGLDLVLVPEHHHGPPGSLTDPVATTAWLLGKTERIRIGPGVLLAPLYDAVRLAEQSAILQEASGDRLFLGLGAGYQREDFDLFSRSLETRKDALRTAVETLKDAWSERGTPLTRPRISGSAPEIWVGAWSRSGIRIAAAVADGWLADPIRSESELVEMAQVYRKASSAAGREPRVHIIRHVWVGETDEDAAAEYLPAIEPVYRYYEREGALTASSHDGSDASRGGRVICGSPERVATRLVELMRATGAEGCSMALRHPAGPTHAAVLAALDLLGREVLPEVRRRLAAAPARFEGVGA